MIKMADVPWFMLSPSPVSLIQYVILTWFGARYLRERIDYEHPWIMSMVHSFLIVALFVVLTDCFCAGLCALKFIPIFPQDADQILFSVARDIVGAILFYLLIGGFFETGVLSFDLNVKVGLLLSLVSQAVWFQLAPSPAYTDYTFAWRYGYSLEFVLGIWMLSHFIMRFPLWISIISAFKNGRKPK